MVCSLQLQYVRQAFIHSFISFLFTWSLRSTAVSETFVNLNLTQLVGSMPLLTTKGQVQERGRWNWYCCSAFHVRNVLWFREERDREIPAAAAGGYDIVAVHERAASLLVFHFFCPFLTGRAWGLYGLACS